MGRQSEDGIQISRKLLIVLVCATVIGYGAAAKGTTTPSPPTARLFQTDADNKILKVLSVDPNSEFVAEGITSLRIECNADYPVQIVYSGNGVSGTIRH